MKQYCILLAVLMILAVTACEPQVGRSTDHPADLTITSVVTSLGGEPDNVEEVIFTYSITILNNSSQTKTITSIEPVLSAQTADRLNGSTQQINELIIEPQESVVVSGTLRFDFTGLTKEEITALEPFIVSLRITNETLLDLP
jgi:hypothetical protein